MRVVVHVAELLVAKLYYVMVMLMLIDFHQAIPLPHSVVDPRHRHRSMFDSFSKMTTKAAIERMVSNLGRIGFDIAQQYTGCTKWVVSMPLLHLCQGKFPPTTTMTIDALAIFVYVSNGVTFNVYPTTTPQTQLLAIDLQCVPWIHHICNGHEYSHVDKYNRTLHQ